MRGYDVICRETRRILKNANTQRRRNLKKGFDVESDDLYIARIKESFQKFKEAYWFLDKEIEAHHLLRVIDG